MVRLVFRPYTQIRRTICTSVSLRTSTRVSSGFVLLRHSSPSFGSQRACSRSIPAAHAPRGRPMVPRAHRCARFPPRAATAAPHFHCASRACHPPTRMRVRLLGPCFKTGRLESLRQRRERARVPPRTRLHALAARGRCYAVAAASGVPRTRAPPSFVGARLPAPLSQGRPSVSHGARCPRAITARRQSRRAYLPAARSAPHHKTHADPPAASARRSVSRRTPPRRRARVPLPIASLLTISSAFDSLFRVLFIFPSRYLFAIGLLPVFSLG